LKAFYEKGFWAHETPLWVCEAKNSSSQNHWKDGFNRQVSGSEDGILQNFSLTGATSNWVLGSQIYDALYENQLKYLIRAPPQQILSSYLFLFHIQQLVGMLLWKMQLPEQIRSRYQLCC